MANTYIVRVRDPQEDIGPEWVRAVLAKILVSARTLTNDELYEHTRFVGDVCRQPGCTRVFLISLAEIIMTLEKMSDGVKAAVYLREKADVQGWSLSRKGMRFCEHRCYIFSESATS